MTITSVQTLLPGRVAVTPTEKTAAKPPPKIYNVLDNPFKGYQPPQPDGYERSRSKPSTSAIVIDNGRFYFACLFQMTVIAY
jgi:actin-related protein 5